MKKIGEKWIRLKDEYGQLCSKLFALEFGVSAISSYLKDEYKDSWPLRRPKEHEFGYVSQYRAMTGRPSLEEELIQFFSTIDDADDALPQRPRRCLLGQSFSKTKAQQRSRHYERSKEKILHDLNDISREFDEWPGRTPPDWKHRRRLVEKRAEYTCERCGASSAEEKIALLLRRNPSKPTLVFHAHHKIPFSKGGTHAISNLEFLCERCHGKEPSRGHKRILKQRLKKEACYAEWARYAGNQVNNRGVMAAFMVGLRARNWRLESTGDTLISSEFCNPFTEIAHKNDDGLIIIRSRASTSLVTRRVKALESILNEFEVNWEVGDLD
ncbi:MAG: HNH endonuclease [Phycisphaerae bacterium]|nr:HNH endonuclease [Phycisphaerae bacterium]